MLALAVCLAWTFLGSSGSRAYMSTYGLDKSKYPVTSEWTVRLEDPDSGTVSLYVSDSEIIGSAIRVTVNDPANPSDILLTGPDGTEYRFPARVEAESNGDLVVIFDDPD